MASTIVVRVIETRRIARMIASTRGDNLHLRNRYAAFLGKSEVLRGAAFNAVLECVR